MSESQSRYSIINELLMKKNRLVNQLDELEESEQDLNARIIGAQRDLKAWKEAMPGKKKLIETQMANIDKSLEAIQKISKETK